MSGAEKFVLGLGNNLDYEVVWNQEVIQTLVEEQGILPEELEPNREIHNLRDLLVSILCFIKNGTGGERFVATPQIIEEFAAKLEKKITLGGTPVRAALAMEKLGVLSSLHLVTLNSQVKQLLPKGCPYVCSEGEKGIYPHLIIQYTKGTRVAVGDVQLVAKQSNRMIYVNDPDNCKMAISEELSGLLAKAKIFLVSGFNGMNSCTLLAKRLEALLKQMEHLPPKGIVYYEDGCFHNPELSRQVRSALIPYITIYSLNEDEWQGYLGRKVNLLDAEDVLDGLETLWQTIPVPYLVVHTRYWALAFGENPWWLEKALKGGIGMATTRFCFGDSFTVADYERTQNLPPEPEGKTLSYKLELMANKRVCCLPSLEVRVALPTTIGLGDAFVGGFIAQFSAQ